LLAAVDAASTERTNGASAARRGRSSPGIGSADRYCHIAQDRALQQHKRDATENEREHPGNDQIEPTLMSSMAPSADRASTRSNSDRIAEVGAE